MDVGSETGQRNTDAENAPLTAFHTTPTPSVEIMPADRWREWMNATDERSANRCLPLLMANEAGWTLLNPASFTAHWDGSNNPGGLRIEYENAPTAGQATSSFGYGVITWGVPYLFRTPPGFNLLARGPANSPKDGVSPLEGLVETDWSVATFTMNWKITRPDHLIRFEAGEPYCMVVPQRRHELESFVPTFRHLRSDPETFEHARNWSEGRRQMHVRKFLSEHSREYQEYWSAWEQDYFRGRYPNGDPAPAHQTKLRLGPFAPT